MLGCLISGRCSYSMWTEPFWKKYSKQKKCASNNLILYLHRYFLWTFLWMYKIVDYKMVTTNNFSRSDWPSSLFMRPYASWTEPRSQTTDIYKVHYERGTSICDTEINTPPDKSNLLRKKTRTMWAGNVCHILCGQ